MMSYLWTKEIPVLALNGSVFFFSIKNPKENALLRCINDKDVIMSQGSYQKRKLTF